MTKKEYMKPAMQTESAIVEQMMAVSVHIPSLGDDDELGYDGESGDMDDAMVNENRGVWDDDDW